MAEAQAVEEENVEVTVDDSKKALFQRQYLRRKKKLL